MTESETMEELRIIINKLKLENKELKEQVTLQNKEWKATQGLRDLLSDMDNDGSCKNCDKLADKIIELDAQLLNYEAKLELADRELHNLRQDLNNTEAWRVNSSKRVIELEIELKQLHSTNQGWLTANAPGGWIDELRKENKILRNLILNFYREKYIDEIIRNELEKSKL